VHSKRENQREVAMKRSYDEETDGQHESKTHARIGSRGCGAIRRWMKPDDG
jgi:hypothetical protein